jgi:hypothetical protein
MSRIGVFIQFLLNILTEPSTSKDLIAAWCFVIQMGFIELTLPVLLGYLEVSTGIRYYVAAFLFSLADKAAILLLAYCLVSTAYDLVLPRVFGYKECREGTS